MSLFPKLTKETPDIASVEEKLEKVLNELIEVRSELQRINTTLHEAESRQFVVKLTK